ncbi:hypothetical protein ACLOJK_013134 [Asimina triloba]
MGLRAWLVGTSMLLIFLGQSTAYSLGKYQRTAILQDDEWAFPEFNTPPVDSYTFKYASASDDAGEPWMRHPPRPVVDPGPGMQHNDLGTRPPAEEAPTESEPGPAAEPDPDNGGHFM